MNILFIGGGNMAAAIIGGLIAKGWPAASLCAVDVVPAALEALRKRYGIRTAGDGAAEALRADCVVLAVKPQQLREVARGLAPSADDRLVLSIAAGIRSADLARWLGGKARVVRAMPNTPALVGAGISGLFAMPGVSAGDRSRAESVLAAVGETFWVEDEAMIDAVTAVSGSGPAYVFYFIEALQKSGAMLGLPEETARLLAIDTFLGAARLAQESPDPVGELRARVTSKGGTTHAAITSLEADGVGAAVERALLAARARAEELGRAS